MDGPYQWIYKPLGTSVLGSHSYGFRVGTFWGLARFGGFPKLGVLFWGPYSKDSTIQGAILCPLLR